MRKSLFKSKNFAKPKAPSKKMNQSKFVELTFLGHNNGGFENKKEWKAFLLFYSQPVAEKGPNFVFGVNW